MTQNSVTPLILSDRFAEAFKYAEEAHRAQMRKGTSIPYISHLMAVAALVLQYGGTEDEAIAALLHDAPEDCGGQARLDDIRSRFGDRVADIVEACSDSLVDDPSQKAPWRERKQQYHEHLRSTVDPGAELVSAADKLHNAQSILADIRRGNDVWSRFNAGRTDVIWNYRELTECYNSEDPRVKAIVAELKRVVNELE